MIHSLVFLNALLPLLTCFVVEPPLRQETTVPQGGSFLTKRIWITVSDSSFLNSQANLLLISTKVSLTSSEIKTEQMVSTHTGLGGSFYYFDMPLSYECFRISSSSSLNANAWKTTDWICNIQPSLLYEITSDVPAKIRKRNDDLEWKRWADAPLLGLILSSYISFDSAYENGYSAYLELQSTWLSYYAGNIEGTTLDNTFLFDYSEKQCQERSPDPIKERKISVREKVSELKNQYTNSPHSVSLATKRDKKIEIIALISIVILSFGIFYLFFLHKNNESHKQQN